MVSKSRDEVVKEAFRYRDALTSFAFALLRDWPRAEDVVQDAFIVVMNKWTEFVQGTSVYLWVRQIVRFKAQEALRSKARGGSALDEELLATVAGAVEKYLDEDAADRQNLMRKALQSCLESVNQRALGLLSGFYGESQSCEAIAQLQRRSVNAIRLSLSRLRKQLHECMTRQMPALEGGR